MDKIKVEISVNGRIKKCDPKNVFEKKIIGENKLYYLINQGLFTPQFLK